MKKKLMAMFMLVAAVAMLVPAGVRAADTHKVYEKGAGANFYLYDRDATGNDGNLTIIMEGNDTAEAKYIKGFVYGIASEFIGTDDKSFYCEDDECLAYNTTTAYGTLSTKVTQMFQNAQEVYLQDGKDGYTIGVITLDEAKDLFGATETADGIALSTSNTAYSKVKQILSVEYDGFYTQTVDGQEVWAVLWDGGSDRIAKVPVGSSGKQIAMVPVLMVDKDEDCEGSSTGQDPEPTDPEPEQPVGTPSHCYVCSEEEYVWATEDEAPAGCEINNDIDAESACTGNPETGVNDYILPITIAVCAAAIALTVITKKDLFRKI